MVGAGLASWLKTCLPTGAADEYRAFSGLREGMTGSFPTGKPESSGLPGAGSRITCLGSPQLRP